MVRRGEYLERAVAFPGETGPLEGLYHRGARAPSLLIAAPHPLAGGSMEIPLIAELAWAVTRAGHATLRFNYRGVGASAGEFDSGAGATEDARRALEHLRMTTAVIDPKQPVALLGVGFGAGVVVSLAAREESSPIELVILLAPEPPPAPESIAHLPMELLLIAPEEESPARRSNLRALAERAPHGRLAVIPRADHAFLRGLVDLGRVVADAIHGII